ncbi:hypothetical protein F383_37342 [Gossypium arboreum]|uniref:Uncharacterized protein n=1 Tax=Gossypium arboreum TaxID=29729 RepID=A0A0B0MC49_GOSAR|nr:hypothetical protein F383_37342 [Gossypium arboreum]
MTVAYPLSTMLHV